MDSTVIVTATVVAVVTALVVATAALPRCHPEEDAADG